MKVKSHLLTERPFPQPHGKNPIISNNIQTKFHNRGRLPTKVLTKNYEDLDIPLSTYSTCETKRKINHIPLRKSFREKRTINKSRESSLSEPSQSYSNSLKKYKKMKLYDIRSDSDQVEYPTKKDVGLISSEEEDSMNNNILEEKEFIDFINEIEKVLINIYNKNFLNFGGKEREKTFDNFEKMKMLFKSHNAQFNLYALKILSDKIKELIQKCKEKVFEISEVKRVYDENIIKEVKIQSNKNIKMNVNFDYQETFSLIRKTSQFKCYLKKQNSVNKEHFSLNNILLLRFKDEISIQDVTNILLRELINIKHKLRISAKEIEDVFEYPLSLLKDDNNQRISFSVELMLLEEFSNVLLNDFFLSELIKEMKKKFNFNQSKVHDIVELIDEVEKDKFTHRKEMTRFDEFINQKLYSESSENYNSSNNYYNELTKENAFTMTSASSAESIEKEENKIGDIDELLKFISEDQEEKKKKRKKKRNRKNKNNQYRSIEKEENVNENENNKEDKQEEKNEHNAEIEEFKKDIENKSDFVYNCQKRKISLSKEFLSKLKIF